MDIREGDIFSFSYSTEYRAKLFEPHHCFDGQLVAAREGDGIVLVDTYWLYQFQPRGDSSRRFTESDARKKGELRLVCNLHDVNKIEKHDAQYYDDTDVFDLSYQHRCYPYFALRNGATRSKEKMRIVVRDKMKRERSNIESAIYNIERLARTELMIEEGRVDEVYL